jgi:peptidyl-prolyl cis-trans isomerase D
MAVMNRMRENTKTTLLILVFAFMLTIIIDWGMGGFKSGQKPGVIATVNGVDISGEQYNQMYRSEMQAHRDRTGSDPEGFQVQQIENQIFETLIQQQLLAQTIKKLDLYATNQEVVDEIYNNPPQFLRQNEAFKDSNGVFSMAMYQAALNNPSANWGPIENIVRSEIPRTKLINLLRSSIVVTEDEVRMDYEKTNAKATAHYIFYDSNSFAESVPEPTEDEINDYYKNHKEDYRKDEQRQIDYVLIPLNPTMADTEAVYNQAQELLADAKSGEDFAQLAEIYSTDTGSAEKGGDLGFFGKGAMVKPFEEAAFAAKKGEIVGPVTSQFGVHIIKVVDKKKENGEEKVQASHILLKFILSPSTTDALLDEANYIADMAKESELATVVDAEGLTLEKSEAFSKEGFIPGLGMELRLNRWAFRSKVGDISEIFTLNQGHVIANLSTITKEHIQPLKEVKDRIVTSLKAEKKIELALAQCNSAYEKIKNGEPIDDVAKSDSLTVQETEEFTMSGYVTGVGREPGFVGAAFAMEIGDYSEPIEGTRGYYILQLVDKKEIDEQAFESQKESLAKQLVERKQQRMFGDWLHAVKEKSKINDYRI